MAKVLTAVVAVLLSVSAAYGAGGETARKQELERVQKQAAQKQEELKKNKAVEKAISKELSALATRQAEAQRQKNKLDSDINYVEQTILTNEEKRLALVRSMPLWNETLSAELIAFYFTPSCPQCPDGFNIEEEVFLDRAMTHKAEFAVALQEEHTATKQKIYDFERQNKQLMAKSSEIQQKQQQLNQNVLKKQQDLTSAQKKTKALSKELDDLNKSARALNDLLARFERQRKEAANKKAKENSTAKTNTPVPASIAKIDVPKHSLPWPVKGQVLSKFGKEYHKDLNTWIFRDGIKIAARAGEPVKCVANGEVIYAGPFRSYGNVVIMDHGKGFFSIYGFLSKIETAVGDKLVVGNALGTAGTDTQQNSGTGKYAVYFEIRQGTSAVDPLEWLEN